MLIRAAPGFGSIPLRGAHPGGSRRKSYAVVFPAGILTRFLVVKPDFSAQRHRRW
jgi:hypothetical protein